MAPRIRFRLGLLLASASLLPPMLHAAGPTEPAVPLPVLTQATPAEVEAFTAKWTARFKEETNKEWGFLLVAEAMQRSETNGTRLLTLLLGALERDPQPTWVGCLQVLAQPSPASPALPPLELLAAWKQACATLEKRASAGSQTQEVKAALELARQQFLAACLETGRNLDEAQSVARQLLASAPTNNWNYGNIVYDAHSALGRIALRQKDRATARQELRAAGRTPGSPQLNSFGPQFKLARELLEQGTAEDREAVVAFLDDVAKFMANPAGVPAHRKEAVLKTQRLIESWKEEVRAGKIPTDAYHWR